MLRSLVGSEMCIRDRIKGNPIEGIKNVIAIASGKGGVGKSTITSNIAITLAKMGFNVGILDADIYGPSIPIMFDIADARPLSVNIEGKGKMKPVESYGVKILSIGFFTKPDQAVIWRGPMASKALNQMIFDAAWGELDFLLVDFLILLVYFLFFLLDFFDFGFLRVFLLFFLLPPIAK